jgi:hypothetical protein
MIFLHGQREEALEEERQVTFERTAEPRVGHRVVLRVMNAPIPALPAFVPQFGVRES